MSATADIQTSRKMNIFTIPIQAVTTRRDTAKQSKALQGKESGEEQTFDKKDELVVVFIAKEDTAFMKIVETGIQDDNYIEIISGIEPNEDIIMAPYSAVSKKLEDKSLLEIVLIDELFKEEEKKK